MYLLVVESVFTFEKTGEINRIEASNGPFKKDYTTFSLMSLSEDKAVDPNPIQP